MFTNDQFGSRWISRLTKCHSVKCHGATFLTECQLSYKSGKLDFFFAFNPFWESVFFSNLLKLNLGGFFFGEISVWFFILFFVSFQPELFLFIVLFFFINAWATQWERERAREQESERARGWDRGRENSNERRGSNQMFFSWNNFFGYLKGNHFNIGKFIKLHIHLAPAFEVSSLGSGGGTSGRATAFCLTERGSNPGTDLAFFRNAINLFSLDVGLSPS